MQLTDISLRDVLKNLDISLPKTRDASVFGRTAFTSTVSASAKAIMLSDLNLHFDDTTATGRAGIQDLGTKALVADLNLDRINADRYLAPAATPAAAPTPVAVPVGAPTPIPVELIRGLTMQGTLHVGTAVFAGVQFSKLRLGISANAGHMRLFPAEAQMYGGEYHGDMTIDAAGQVPRVNFDEHIAGVDFAPLFRDLLANRHVSGRGSGAIKGVATGLDSAALLRTLSGNLDFHVDHGAFEGTDLWYEIRRAQALIKQQPIPARSGPERTEFTAVSATGRLVNGVLGSEDLLAALQYLQVKGRGTANIASGVLDFRLDALGSSNAGDAAGLSIPVLVSGTFGAPKVRPDVAGIVKARVKQKLQDALQDKLKELFGQ